LPGAAGVRAAGLQLVSPIAEETLRKTRRHHPWPLGALYVLSGGALVHLLPVARLSASTRRDVERSFRSHFARRLAAASGDRGCDPPVAPPALRRTRAHAEHDRGRIARLLSRRPRPVGSGKVVMKGDDDAMAGRRAARAALRPPEP